MSIPDIFAKYGEEVFRKYETEAIRELGKKSGAVIATGGGCITRAENYPLLHQNGVIVWLKRDISMLPKDGRPISQKSDLDELYEARRELYAQFSDFAADNNGSAEAAARAKNRARIWVSFYLYSYFYGGRNENISYKRTEYKYARAA